MSVPATGKHHYNSLRNSFLIFLFSLLTGTVQAGNNKTITAAEERLKYLGQLGQSTPDTAFLAVKDLYNDAVARKNPLLQALCLRQMGTICYHLGHYAQALDYHLQAGRLFRSQNKPAWVAANLNDLGILYYYNRESRQSRKAYDEAMAIYKRLHNAEGIAVTYGKIGHLYEKHQRYDSAFYYQRQALNAYQKIGHKYGIAKIYENLGSIFEDLEQYDSAYHYFRQSLLLYQQTDNRVDRIEVLNNLGDIFRKTGHYRKGLEQTQQALQLAHQTNELYQLSAACRDMGKSYHLLHRDDSSFYYLELSRKYLLEIYSREGIKETAFLQALYDTEKKNREIENLKYGRKISMLISISVTAIIILLIVSSILITNRQKLKIKNERQNNHIYETRHELIQAELKNKKMAEEQLKNQLESKTKELSIHTLHVIQKNQLLEELRGRLEEIVKDEKRDQKKQLRQIIQRIGQNFNQDQYWADFRNIFEQIHQSFFENLKVHSEELTANDFRLIALLKMNLGSGDIATLLGISPDSLRVARYRLRKKLNLGQGENLSAFLQTI